MVSVDRHLFPRAQEVTYLDTAAEGLPPATARDAMARYFEAKLMGSPGRPRLYETEHRCLEQAARLLGTEPVNVGFMAHASDGLNLLANSLEWNPGDEVVITDLEFPSNVVAWLRLRERGVEVRVVPSEQGRVDAATIAAAITSRTRVVSVSYVSYKTGARISGLSDLAEAAHRHGAIFCVDATQALGRVPIPLAGVDFLVASSYKWLLGIHGLGLIYIDPAFRERLRLSSVGWYSIDNVFAPDRFERFSFKSGAAAVQTGMPSFAPMFVLSDSLQYLLGIGVDQIHSRLQPLIRQLRSGIETLGFELLTPSGDDVASGIVSFAHADPAAIGAALASEGVVVWAGDGRVRASVHVYNDERDIRRCLDVLARTSAGVPA